MRITNKMMTNNVLHNIGNNKSLLSKLEDQYSTGKKIQKPSDDPIIAVRALKLRTNLSELTQYVEKNIPDALSWMDTTESAMNVVNEILRQMNTYCDQGANDPLTATDRKSIVTNLSELREQIYQEGNTNYAGRYVFSGYKTDTTLVFDKNTTDYEYQIEEPLNGDSIMVSSKVVDSVDMGAFDKNDVDSFDKTMPNLIQIYRMRLAYNDIDSLDSLTYTDGTVDAGGNAVKQTLTVNTVSVTDAGAYEPADGEVNFIPETGEVIFGKDAYELVRKSENITANYKKDSFNQNELRPEHFFNCVRTEKDGGETLTYKKENQEIQYEVNFNQKLTINIQGDAAFSHDIGRALDDIINSVNDVMATEEKMAEVAKMLEDTTLTKEQREALEGINEQLKSEFTLRTEVMQMSFARGLTDTSNQQDKLNVALSELGGSYNRLLLTQSRLEDQQVDFEDLLSTNEDADLVDTIVKFSSAETIYNSSLSAASKLVQTSLLDFL